MTAAGRAIVADKPELRRDIVAVEVQAEADQRDWLRKRLAALPTTTHRHEDPDTKKVEYAKVVRLAAVMALIEGC